MLPAVPLFMAPAGIIFQSHEPTKMTPEEAALKAAENQSFIGQILAWASGGIALIGAWLWTNTMGRIQHVERTKVDQVMFDAYVARADHDRTERRDTEIALFAKLDHLKDMIGEIRK